MIAPVHMAFFAHTQLQFCRRKELCEPKLIHVSRVGTFLRSWEFETPSELKVFVHQLKNTWL